jgi:hypothetical protein
MVSIAFAVSTGVTLITLPQRKHYEHRLKVQGEPASRSQPSSKLQRDRLRTEIPVHIESLMKNALQL